MGLFNFFTKKIANKNCNTCLTQEFEMTDIHYRALNRLKNSKISNPFSGELSVTINQEDFCNYCLSQELIRFSTLEEDLKLTTVEECKTFLKDNFLKTSGKKAELVQRILDYDSSFFGSKHYVITEKGISALHDYWNKRALDNFKSDKELFTLKLSKYDISEQQYLCTKERLPFNPTENDIIWGILNERAIDYSVQKSYYNLRNNYLNMALLLEEEKSYDRALEYFLMTVCFDINGFTPYYQVTGEIGKPTLVQWICNRIHRLRSYYNQELVVIAYSQCQVKKHYFSETSFLMLINDIVTSENQITHTQSNDFLYKYIS